MRALKIPILVIFEIIIPWIEIVADYMFCAETIIAGHPWIGSIMMGPNILVLIYNLWKWFTTNLLSKCEKCMIFFIPFFSPYLHLKIFLKSIWKCAPVSEWTRKHNEIKEEFGNVEPFLKTIPSLYLKYCIFAILLVRDSGGANQNHAQSFCTMFSTIFEKEECKNEEIKGWIRIDEKSCTSKVIEVFGESEYGISNEILFPVLLVISLISGIYRVSMYLINGPFKITSKNNCCNHICNALKFLYVLAEFFCKLDVFLQICMMTTSEEYHGYLPFLIIFGWYVFVPALLTFTPLVCQLGWKRTITFVWQNPALLTVSFITDFIVSPSEGCCGNKYR